MTARLPLFVLLVGASSACHVNKAPSDLDGNAHWFWANYVGGTDADIAAAVNTLNGIPTISDVLANGNWTGVLPSTLSKGELSVVTLEKLSDPSKAPGLVAITDMPCTLDKIHTGTYVSYARTYDTSIDDYKSRKSETVAWTSNISVDQASNAYSETVKGGLRRIPDQGKTITPFGPVLLSRTWLTKPAVFTTPKGSFAQDYQIEVYYERTPGHVIHSFVDWRQLTVVFLGGQVSSADTTYQSVILSNDVNWDKDSAKLCGK